MSSSLAARREALVAQAQLQRAQLQTAAAEIRKRLSFTDGVFAVAARIKREPVLIGTIAAAAATLLIRPRGIIKWIGYAATAYSLVRRVRSLLQR